MSVFLLLLCSSQYSLPCLSPSIFYSLYSQRVSTLGVTACPLVTLTQIRVKPFVYCEEGKSERNSAVLNVKDDEVGQAGSAVVITAVFALHHQKTLKRAKSSSSTVSPRN